MINNYQFELLNYCCGLIHQRGLNKSFTNKLQTEVKRQSGIVPDYLCSAPSFPTCDIEVKKENK